MRNLQSIATTAFAVVALTLAACGLPEAQPPDESVDVVAPIVAPIDIRTRLTHEFEWAKDYPVVTTWNQPPSVADVLAHEFPPSTGSHATSQFIPQLPAR